MIGTSISGEPAKYKADGVKSRDGGGNLNGIVDDGFNVYKYFKSNGAKISLFYFTEPADGSACLRKVHACLSAPGNNKLLYISGHGDNNGMLPVGDGQYLQLRDVLNAVAASPFQPKLMVTLVLDTCYSGMWAKQMRALVSRKDPVLSSFQRREFATFIFRLSSLPHETSLDSVSGGMYTTALINNWRMEHSWTPNQVGEGWGTKMWHERNPNEKDALFSMSTSAPQTDIAMDFVWRERKHVRAWKQHVAGGREKYVEL